MTLIIATGNAHKVSEIAAFLGLAVVCISMKKLGTPPNVIEDAPTFKGNAAKKCSSLASWIQEDSSRLIGLNGSGPIAVLADDSGLEVDFLQGAPGVHSARFAHLDRNDRPGNAPDAENNAKLLRMLEGVEDPRRKARFRCVLAMLPLNQQGVIEGAPLYFEGMCEGRILTTPTGDGGFGYDPLFVPDGHSVSFAELGSLIKNQISHRAQALACLARSPLFQK